MTLMAAPEAELARRGITRPWLACGVGKDRAKRFYEKAGWRNAGKVPYRSVTRDGAVEVMVWRFERGVPEQDHLPVLVKLFALELSF
jgi:hypothetical protein